jgi:leucyl/phenylalanyl-tRNA---protein transferase
VPAGHDLAVPAEPTPSVWVMPDPAATAETDLVAVGADLEPGTLLAAYRSGMFPMPVEGTLGWWSPDPRGILPLDGLLVSRSLRKACGRFEVRVDTAVDEVVTACADPDRTGGWISDGIRAAYCRMHRLGWVHSVETWADGELVGGLYGVAVGGFFAGESMFHRRTDASKVALVALVDLLNEGGATLLDVQWRTPHLASLGVVDVTRTSYLTRLTEALERPLPAVFDHATS